MPGHRAPDLRHLTSALLACCSLLTTAARGQERTFALGAPDWLLAEPLTRVAGIGRLADGRVLITDARDRTMLLAAADGRSLRPFASQGEGPGEYRMPLAILRARGDTLLVYDAGNQRYLRVAPDGARGVDLPIPAVFVSRGGLSVPRGIDTSGAIYWQGDVIGLDGGMPKRLETQNVRRWRPPAERLDTVAEVRDHAAAMHAMRFHPFAERDAFVVARDGRVGVLDAREYRLRWYRDGREVVAGPAIEHTRVPVTAREREAFRRERAAQPSGMARLGAAGSEEPRADAVRRTAQAFPDALFPPTKPPFEESGALLSPAEDVWVIRSGAVGSPRARIDVLAPDGSRRGHLLLPPGRRLLAIEAEGIYLARIDEDGLEWLERYPWPAGLR